jgi:hypothetical protein
MSFRRCKGTAISAPPQSHHWGILYTINMVLTQIPPPQIRLALGSGTDVKSLATFSSGPDPSARPRRGGESTVRSESAELQI